MRKSRNALFRPFISEQVSKTAATIVDVITVWWHVLILPLQRVKILEKSFRKFLIKLKFFKLQKVVCIWKLRRAPQLHQMVANLRASIDTMEKYLSLQTNVINVGAIREKLFVHLKMNAKILLLEGDL